MKFKLLILFFCLFTTTCKNVSRYETLKRLNIDLDGKKREYIIYIPKGLASNPPLIIALHGHTDNGSAFMNYTGLNKVADKNGFAVCYPQGLTDSSGKTFWQVGYSFHRNEDAAAPVAGCMMKVVYDSCSSSTPIPVFMINGTEDKITWWDGDLNDMQHYGAYFPVLTTFGFLLA